MLDLIPTRPSHERKLAFMERLVALFEKYNNALIISADNVTSAHMQSIRKDLRALDSVLVMGKNTQMRKALRARMAENAGLEAVLPFVKGNVGFVFVSAENQAEAVEVLKTNRRGAPAKVGVPAPNDVIVPAGNTGMQPTETSFLQALNIASKISRGQIEILKDVQLLTKGDKVGASQAALLAKLGIKPFTYGLEIEFVYDNGNVYNAAVLDITDDDVLGFVAQGVQKIAAISLATNVPTLASVPHSLINGYKNVMAVAIATEYTYPEIEEFKTLLNDPEALAAAAAAASSAAAPAAEEKKEEAPAEESDSESSEMGGMSMFD